MFFWKLSDIFGAIFESETFWKTEISGRFCLFNLFVYYMKITVLHLNIQPIFKC